jgi:monoamine oxidase
LQTEVIIIGGGVAGLAAADELLRAGRKFLLVEARHRLGGRILTGREASETMPIELGAEFIHGKPPALFDLIKEAKLRVVEGDDRRFISENGALRQLDDFWEIIERVDSQLSGENDTTYQTFLDTVNASAFEKKIAKSYVEGFNAARADQISTAALKFEEEASEKIDGTRQFRLTGGYDQIVRHLAREVAAGSVQLGCAVRAVKWRKGEVEVRADTAAGEVRVHGKRAIVTLPLGVLRASIEGQDGIVFDPPLEAKREALTHLETGHVVKLILQFREAFWNDRDQSLAGSSFGFALNFEVDFPTWWTQSPAFSNLLTGWAGGPAADKLTGCDREQLRNAALDSISRTFGVTIPQLRSLLVRDWYHDWATDPFALGAYSYPKAGGLDAAKLLGQPLDDALFFAGEATDVLGFNGTVHGAIGSGLRAAREIPG